MRVAAPREWDYTIWEATKLGTEGVRHYICFRMFSRPDDQTKRAIEMSSFMYGFLKSDGAEQGVACWYTVLSDESMKQAQLWMAGAEWSKP